MRSVERGVSVLITLVLTLGLSGLAWQLYQAAGREWILFVGRLGELVLQLAVLVVVGGAVRELGVWLQERGATRSERDDHRRDFASRARANHVAVEQARTLIRAHRSFKTYSEQLEHLVRVRYEVEDLAADLKASAGLFEGSGEIIDALTGIVGYLDRGIAEYKTSYGALLGEMAPTDDKSFRGRLEEEGMTWTLDFYQQNDGYQRYVSLLTASKGAMRRQVYGA